MSKRPDLDEACGKALFAWMKASRATFEKGGLTPRESFETVYILLVNAVISGAIAYDISEGELHEVINEVFSEATKDLKQMGITK